MRGPTDLESPPALSPELGGASQPRRAAQRLDPPETFCQKDDSSLQHRRGKDLQDLLKAETAQQRTEIHVLEVGVQGPRQRDELQGIGREEASPH